MFKENKTKGMRPETKLKYTQVANDIVNTASNTLIRAAELREKIDNFDAEILSWLVNNGYIDKRVGRFYKGKGETITGEDLSRLLKDIYAQRRQRRKKRRELRDKENKEAIQKLYKLNDQMKKFIGVGVPWREKHQSVFDWGKVGITFDALEEVPARIELDMFHVNQFSCVMISKKDSTDFTEEQRILCEKALNGELVEPKSEKQLNLELKD